MNSIMVTVSLEGSLWVALFERTDSEGKAVARHVFGKEPTDPELYEFILAHFRELEFSLPHDFRLIIKRKNPQRMQREVRREMEKAKKTGKPKESIAQEVLRKELEEKKQIRKARTKTEKEAEAEKKFIQRQEKRKEKHRGH